MEYGIDGFDADAGSTLRHGEDVDYADGVVVHKFAEHETHYFHRNTGAAMAKHLEEGEGGDVDGFGVVDKI